MFKACKKSFKRCFLFPNPSTFLKVDFSKNLLNLTNNSHLLGSMVFMCPNNTLICLIHLSRKLQTMERNIWYQVHTLYWARILPLAYIVAAVDRVLCSYFTNSVHVRYKWFPVCCICFCNKCKIVSIYFSIFLFFIIY